MKEIFSEKTRRLWAELLSSEKKSASAMRWVFLFTALMLNTTVWGIWAAISLYRGVLQEIPNGVYLAYWGALTVATGGKVAQSIFAETKNEQPSKEEIKNENTT